MEMLFRHWNIKNNMIKIAYEIGLLSEPKNKEKNIKLNWKSQKSIIKAILRFLQREILLKIYAIFIAGITWKKWYTIIQ